MNGKAEHRNEEFTIDFSCCYPELIFCEGRRREIGNKKLQELQERRRLTLNYFGETKCINIQ
jgi:hypothetical protein